MTNDDVYSNTKNDVAFAVSKSYLHSKFPEYDDFFEDIWNIAIANLKTNRKIMPTSKEAGALHFVIDNALVEIVNLIIPFISGVVSSVIAGFLLQKHCENPKVTADIIQKSAESVIIELNIPAKTAKDMIPHILQYFENEEIFLELKNKRMDKTTG